MATTFASDIKLEGGAEIKNLRVETFTAAFPDPAYLGQIVRYAGDGLLYRYEERALAEGLGTTGQGWYAFGGTLSQLGFDELPENRYNVAASEAAVRQAYDYMTQLSQQLERNRFQLKLLPEVSMTQEAFVISVEEDNISIGGFGKLQAYKVGASFGPREIIVTNPYNAVQNNIGVVENGDILLPLYLFNTNSWTYQVIRGYVNGGTMGGALVVNGVSNLNGFTVLGENLGINNGQYAYWKDAGGNYRQMLGLSALNFIIGDATNSITNSANIYCANYGHAFYTNAVEAARLTQGTFSFFNTLGGLGEISRISAWNTIGTQLEAASVAFIRDNMGDGYFGAIVFNTFGSNERMRIGSNGAVSIGTATPSASAILDIVSTTKGFLCPRMTTAQINAIASPTKGLQVYNTDLDCMCVYTGSWQKMTTTAM